MAASIHKRFGEPAEIKVGKTGQFDVLVDGRLIFSKAEAGRFPAEGEVEELIANLKKSGGASGGNTPAPGSDEEAGSDEERKRNAGAAMLRRLSDRFRN